MTLIFDSKKVKENVDYHNEIEKDMVEMVTWLRLGWSGEDFFKEVTWELTLSFSDWGGGRTRVTGKECARKKKQVPRF